MELLLRSIPTPKPSVEMLRWVVATRTNAHPHPGGDCYSPRPIGAAPIPLFYFRYQMLPGPFARTYSQGLGF